MHTLFSVFNQFEFKPAEKCKLLDVLLSYTIRSKYQPWVELIHTHNYVELYVLENERKQVVIQFLIEHKSRAITKGFFRCISVHIVNILIKIWHKAIIYEVRWI